MTDNNKAAAKAAAKAALNGTTTSTSTQEEQQRAEAVMTDMAMLKMVEKRIRDGHNVAVVDKDKDDKGSNGTDTTTAANNGEAAAVIAHEHSEADKEGDADELLKLVEASYRNAQAGVAHGGAYQEHKEDNLMKDKLMKDKDNLQKDCKCKAKAKPKRAAALAKPLQDIPEQGFWTDEQRQAMQDGSDTPTTNITNQDVTVPLDAGEETPRPPSLKRSAPAATKYRTPGAYQDAPGVAEPVRTDKLRFSLVGRESELAAFQAALRDNSESGPKEDLPELPPSTPPPSCRRSSARTSETLSVATPVLLGENDSSAFGFGFGSSQLNLPLPVAEEFQANKSAQQQQQQLQQQLQQRQHRKKLVTIMIGIGLIVIVTLTLLLTFLLAGSSNKSTENNNLRATVTMSPTPSPTLSMEEYLMQLLPAATLRAIRLNPDDAPQSLALQWLLADPSLLEYTDQRLQQRFALAVFYYATGGEAWRNNTNWLSYDSHECAWFSRKYFEDVELYMQSGTAHTFLLMYNSESYPCSHNTTGVWNHLWLYKNDLSGSLPMDELTLLSDLKSMALFGNANLQVQMTSELGLLRKLEGIEFSSMGVEGSLPTEIGLLTNMKAILASNNLLQGRIPSEYGLLSQLEYSMLSNNDLTGSIPTTIANMSSLSWLYLYNNHLTGSLPAELSSMTAFQFLNAYSNYLTGSLPPNIGDLSHMVLLALSDNLMTGTLPSSLGGMTDIRQGLSLNRNLFHGDIPTELGLLTGITGTITGSGTYGLGLAGSDLAGRVPSELGMLSVLERIYLQDNNLTGQLPSELSGMAALSTLLTQGNDLTGDVPKELELLVTNGSLVELDVTGNVMLTGSVSDSLCGALIFDCGSSSSSSLCGCNCTCGGE